MKFQVSDLLGVLLDRVEALLNIDTAAVLLLNRHGSHLVARVARGMEGGYQGARVAVDSGFAGEVATRRAPVALEEISSRTVENPILRSSGIKSLLGVPLIDEGRLLGVLHVGTRHHRRFTDGDVGLLEEEAARMARLVSNHEVLVERVAARTVHESLLPGRLPDVEGLEFATRFVAAEDFGVGGDWFDVFTLTDGRVGIVIGDVAGIGLRSAIVMSRLRSALRAYALETDSPGEALARLARKFDHFEPDALATVLYITVSPERDRFTCASFGHPPPVVAAPGEKTMLLSCAPNPPVGSRLATHDLDTVSQLPPGGTVGCYTDGLVERRGEPIDLGLERLCSAFHAGDPEQVCDSIMTELVGPVGVSDDTALLVFRRVP